MVEAAKDILAPLGAVEPFFVFLAAFIPPLLYLAFARRTGGRASTRWWKLGLAFGFGAVAAVLLAWFGSALANAALLVSFPGAVTAFTSTIAVAPFVEEAAKAAGLLAARRRIRSARDGILVAIAVGLGFAATENLLYGLLAYVDADTTTWVLLAAGRAASSTLLHPAAAALVGRAYGRAREAGRQAFRPIASAYLLAVALHAGYNYLVAYTPMVVIEGYPVPVGYPVAVILALTAFARLAASHTSEGGGPSAAHGGSGQKEAL